MKKLLLIITLLLFSIIYYSCKKESIDTVNYHLSKTVFYTHYETNTDITEINYFYQENHLLKSEYLYNSELSGRQEYSYNNDQVKVLYYNYIDNIWTNNLTKRLLYNSNSITNEITYMYADTTKYLNSFYTYSDGILMGISTLAVDGIDSSLNFKSIRYYDNSGKLSKYSTFTRVLQEDDPIETLRHILSYENNLLSEELIYEDLIGYQFQLSRKKVYTYENSNIAEVDHYVYNNNEFVLDKIEKREYDQYDNLISIIESDTSGTILTETINTYEPGTYSYYTFYSVTDARDSYIPKP